MRLLAIDTATEACSAALWLDGEVCARVQHAGRSHMQLLLPMVQALMADSATAFASLDALVCGVGPGSFAGIRIGVAYVKGLALALDLPVIRCNSLEVLAQRAIGGGAERVLTAIDARMNEVYAGFFVRSDAGLAQAAGALALGAADSIVAPAEAGSGRWHGAGSGWSNHAAALAGKLSGGPLGIDALALPQAADALQLALPRLRNGIVDDAQTLDPIYLRNHVALNLQEQAIARAANQR